MSGQPMRGLREQLAEAEIALQAAEDAFAVAKAKLEVLLLVEAEAAGVKLTNEAAQKRYLTAHLPDREGYAVALAALRDAQAEVLRLQARLDAERDRRRADELAVQRRLLDLARPAELVLRPAPLLEPEEQRELVDEIIGRLQVKLADWVREAEIQPGRVSAWRVIFDAEWKAKPAVDVLFHELREELSRLEGKSPARAPLACPGAGCDGYLVVERRLSERVPVVGLGALPSGEPTYLEGVRATVECGEIEVGVCTECGSGFDPAEYRRLTEAGATAATAQQ